MTTATAAKPTPGKKTPPTGPTTYLPAPIEEINSQIIASWEQLGILAKIKIQKDTLLKLCNLQEMPLIGIDVIPTQQGPKLYINGEGAKFNRERYLHNAGRRMVSRKVEEIPYADVPHAEANRDKAQGRIYFRITTTVEDVEQKAKIVDAVASGKIPAADVKAIMDQLKIVTEYQTLSSFSNQSEKYDVNRQPDVILKKGVTQCNRRADLEISSQCVIPEDEEPLDAQFIVKSGEVLDQATDKAKDAAAGNEALKPAKVAEMPETTTAPAKATPGPVGEGPKKDVGALITEINAIFDKGEVKKADRMKWFTENGLPMKKSEMTVEILTQAIEKAKATDFKKLFGQPAKVAPQKDDTAKVDPEKQKMLGAIFGQHKKAGFGDEDAIRAWVKEEYGKGLSEMNVGECGDVRMRVEAMAKFLSNFQNWGFAAEVELKEYLETFGEKALHKMSVKEIGVASAEFEKKAS
jgi:hypothetical protein